MRGSKAKKKGNTLFSAISTCLMLVYLSRYLY